jgi:CBS domain containing-hemolysin-like protein
MIKSIPAYVTIKRWELYGLKAIPTKNRNLETSAVEFIIIQPNPQKVGRVWLTRNEIC